MKHYSTKGIGIEIDILSGELLFIDPLYFPNITRDIKKIKDLPKTKAKEFIVLIEATFLPFGGGTLLGYKSINNDSGIYRFDVNTMDKFDLGNENLVTQAIQKDITSIGIDSASFLILDLVNFENILRLIRFDELGALTDDCNNYFEGINKQLGNKGWGYVASPGTNSGFVFEGDGSYIIN